MRHVGLRRTLYLWMATLLVGIAAFGVGPLLGVPAAHAHAANTSISGTVFVQTNDPAGNSIMAFRRHADGTLSQVAIYPTGGDGGRETSAKSDPLGSQGSLLFDAPDSLLFAVNAGSNTVSIFGVQGDRLHLHQVIASGGSFPVGFARSGSLLYVLNAGLAGAVSGFRIVNGQLSPIKASTRSLGLSNTTPPFFLSSPGQVGFTPSGGQLVVTTKTNGTTDVFAVNAHGLLSHQPVQTAVAGVPFAFNFDVDGQLVLESAATITNGKINPDSGSVATYTFNPDGTLSVVSGPVSDGQTAPCWINEVGGFDYVANTGSGTLSQYRVSKSGTVTLVNATAASGIAGPIDLASAGGTLYNQAGLSSSVGVFAVGAGGELTLIQTQTIPDGASQEGIAAS